MVERVGGQGATVLYMDEVAASLGEIESLPPAGIGLAAAAGLRRLDGGRILIGGSPLRIVRLADAGAAVVDAWLDGTPLADVKSARGLARRLLDAGLVHPVVVPAADPPAVTAVVPAWNCAEALARLLPTLQVPAIVVDDASDSPLDIDGAATEITVLRLPENGGPGAARMSGLAAARTDLVAFVDADVVLPSGWWAGLAPYFDDPAVVAVAPRVASAPGPSLRERYEEAHSPLDTGTRPASVGPKRFVAYVPSAALVVRKSAVTEVGGFDPELRVGEDVDLIWRLAAIGTVRYAPEVVALHAPRSSWLRMIRQRVQYGSSAVPLAARHGDVVAPARCSRWSLAAWGAAIGGFPIIGSAIAAASSAALVKKLGEIPNAPREAARLAGWGNVQAALGLCRATSRVWWPVAIPMAARSRRLRRGVAAAMVVPAALDWWQGHRPTDPVRSVALRVADDMAYGVGVWAQVLRSRDYGALVPDLTEWPGRRQAVEPITVPKS